jgi:MFS transporter, Spinster family, sphingosine-1-phosphate transporter
VSSLPPIWCPPVPPPPHNTHDNAHTQCVIPPFITDLGGSASGRWLALFYTAIPLGTAIGYPWGSLFATSSWGWAWAFYVESILMLPVAVLCFFLPFTWRPERAPIEEEEVGGGEGAGLVIAGEVKSGEEGEGEEAERRRSLERHAAADAMARAAGAHMTLKEEFLAVVRRPIYLLNVFGYAATTAMMIGISTFGSALLLEFGCVLVRVVCVCVSVCVSVCVV